MTLVAAPARGLWSSRSLSTARGGPTERDFDLSGQPRQSIKSAQTCDTHSTNLTSGELVWWRNHLSISGSPLLRLSWWRTSWNTRWCPWALWCLVSISVSTQDRWKIPRSIFPRGQVVISRSVHTSATFSQSSACAYALVAYSETYNGLFL